MRHSLPITLSVCAFCAVSACSSPAEEERIDELGDPLIEQALGDQLMVDPDLASQNEANAALTVAFDSSIPPLTSGPEQRAEAGSAMRTFLLEGGAISDLPEPNAKGDWPDLTSALTAAERADRIGFSKQCAQRINYSAIWAARLPDFAAVAPKGAVVEAAGNPEKQCDIRIVTYVTDLPVEKAIQYHFNLAQRAKLAPLYRKGEESALQATSPKASLAVHARAINGFQTEVDVIVRQY